MQARRKPVESTRTAPPEEMAPVEVDAPVRVDPTHRVADGDLPISPALLLREQLAARLAEANAGVVETVDTTNVVEFKLPMALRITTIVTLSVALWGGIYVSAIKLITG